MQAAPPAGLPRRYAGNRPCRTARRVVLEPRVNGAAQRNAAVACLDADTIHVFLDRAFEFFFDPLFDVGCPRGGLQRDVIHDAFDTAQIFDGPLRLSPLILPIHGP